MPRVPPEGRRFKKGEVHNPNGSSAKSRAIAQVKRMGVHDLAQLISDLVQGTEKDLTEAVANPNKNFMVRLTARLLLDCYANSDINIFKAVMDRTVGRPKESLELSGKDGGPVQVQSLGEIEERLAAIRRLKKETGND